MLRFSVQHPGANGTAVVNAHLRSNGLIFYQIIQNARKVRETLGAAGDEGETALLIDETVAAVEKLRSSLGKKL